MLTVRAAMLGSASAFFGGLIDQIGDAIEDASDWTIGAIEDAYCDKYIDVIEDTLQNYDKSGKQDMDGLLTSIYDALNNTPNKEEFVKFVLNLRRDGTMWQDKMTSAGT